MVLPDVAVGDQPSDPIDSEPEVATPSADDASDGAGETVGPRS